MIVIVPAVLPGTETVEPFVEPPPAVLYVRRHPCAVYGKSSGEGISVPCGEVLDKCLKVHIVRVRDADHFLILILFLFYQLC